MDYIQFCGGPAPDYVNTGQMPGSVGHRIRPQELHNLIVSSAPLEILDVRPSIEYGICQLPGSQNIPLKDLLLHPERHIPSDPAHHLYVVCRLGNDSQIAAEALRRIAGNTVIKDMIGGLRAWSTNVDPNFPLY